MDSPATNAELTGNHSLRSSEDEGGLAACSRPTQEPVSAATDPSPSKNQADMADDQTKCNQLRGGVGVHSPPNYQSSMPYSNPEWNQLLGVSDVRSPPNKQSCMDDCQSQGSQARSIAIIAISICHLLAGILTGGLGFAIFVVVDFIWSSLLFSATGILGLIFAIMKESSRAYIIAHMVMSILCVTFAFYGVKELVFVYGSSDYYTFQRGSSFEVSILQMIVYFIEFVCAIVGSSILCYQLNAAQRPVTTQMVVSSGGPNVQGQA